MDFIHTFLRLNLVLDSNVDGLTSLIESLDQTNITALTDAFNDAIGKLIEGYDYMCVNSCEGCSDGLCGLLETSASQSVSYNVGNYTYEDILTGNFDFESDIANVTFSFLNCFDYTSSEDGKVCLGVDYDSIPIPGADLPCFIEYNGVPYNSCVFSVDSASGEGNDCYVADCTNIESTAMIDSCNGTGFVGPFTFLRLPAAGLTNSTFTTGSCDIAVTPTAATPVASAPTAAAPVEATPTVESPIVVPVSAPTTVAEPTLEPPANVPTAVDVPSGGVPTAVLPTTPMATPIAATPTTRAVAPAAPGVSAPTSGSSGHLIGVSSFLLGSMVISIFTMMM
jgi:hypothetical protein